MLSLKLPDSFGKNSHFRSKDAALLMFLFHIVECKLSIKNTKVSACYPVCFSELGVLQLNTAVDKYLLPSHFKTQNDPFKPL